jgi:hypothetical protein
MGDEIVPGGLDRLAEHDRVPRRPAVEASERRQAEEPWPDEDAHAVDAHRPRVEVEPVEPRLRALERERFGSRSRWQAA